MSRVEFKERKIFIDGKAAQIFSGAIHYFRVHPDLWRDRLEKLAMCGFNCLETYMNLSSCPISRSPPSLTAVVFIAAFLEG